MLIRSQDKKTIVNMNNIDTICTMENQLQYFNGGDSSMGVLGEYSTEEKAIKVLDMMCYNNFWCQDVFQMPQDDEVTI